MLLCDPDFVIISESCPEELLVAFYDTAEELYPDVEGKYKKGDDIGTQDSTPYWHKEDGDNLMIIFNDGVWVIKRNGIDTIIATGHANRFGTGICPSTTPTEWAYKSSNNEIIGGTLVTVSEYPGNW